MVARRLRFWPPLQVLHRARRMNLWAEIKPLLRDRLFPVRIAPTKEGNPSPPVLFQMATGYWVSQAIYVAAKLGIADLLKDGPQSCVALAASTGSDVPSLFRLMRALSSVGMGDLHHALDAGVITLASVYAELGEVVAGNKPGRESKEEITIFDSTGTALQDVAAAAFLYEKAQRDGCGVRLDFAA